MGAWGSGPLENDDAADFVGDLLDATDPVQARDILGEALQAVTAGEGYLDAPTIACGLAAVTVVAVLAGASAPARADDILQWEFADDLRSDGPLRSEALEALNRALDPQDNEWWELWEEAELLDAVTADAASLRVALADRR